MKSSFPISSEKTEKAGSLAGNEEGGALLMVLVVVALVGIGAALTGQSWSDLLQREREEELLWRGLQYQRAIESFVSFKHGNGPALFPSSLDDLVKDPRSLTPVRHLRKAYLDPVTGLEWELIKDEAGRIKGVRSASTLSPFRQKGFPEGLEQFSGKPAYRDWEFIAKPSASSPAGKGGAI